MTSPKSTFWKGKKVLVTGGTGFLGSHLVDLLIARDAQVRATTRNAANARKDSQRVEIVQGDLREAPFCESVCRGQDVVIHAAAHVGGIQYNEEHPGTIFRDNAVMTSSLLESVRAQKVQRWLLVSSASVIPLNDTSDPVRQGYSWSKRFAEIESQTYAKEFGLSIGIVRPCHIYGPGDHFGAGNSTHVITGLLDRLLSGQDPLVVWGNGEQSRQFIYVTDLARGILDCAEKDTGSEPINLGTDEEVKIRDLVALMMELSGRIPKMVFDTTKPTGQLRCAYDYSVAKAKLGFTPEISLREGLKRTLAWYNSRVPV